MNIEDIKENIKARINIAETHLEEVKTKGLEDLNEYFNGYIVGLSVLLKDLEESCI